MGIPFGIVIGIIPAFGVLVHGSINSVRRGVFGEYK